MERGTCNENARRWAPGVEDALRESISRGEQCKRSPRCANYKDSDGEPTQGHSVWYSCCTFPKTIVMRKKAMSRREDDPWWWDSENERRKREKTANTTKPASQVLMSPSTSDDSDSCSQSSNDEIEMIQLNSSQPMITSHFLSTRHHIPEDNGKPESPASCWEASSGLDDVQSMQSEQPLL